MSFRRHAYRHTVPPLSHCLVDHVWISEEFLASTYRRFANGQRRYESRVPGPLEARRRLAKRKNTVLASLAGSRPPDDIGCLFGRNGREHMKWVGGQARNAPQEVQGSSIYPTRSPAFPSPLHNKNVDSSEFSKSPGWPVPSDKVGQASFEQCLEENLKNCQTVIAIQDVVRKLQLDLQRQPAYSRLIFEHLLSQMANHRWAFDELVKFLDDPHLNTWGAGNYLCTVNRFVFHQGDLARWSAPLGSVTTALQLGRVPEDEICQIIEALFDRVVGSGKVKQRVARRLVAFYRKMWDAIGWCSISEYEDLDKKIIETWLGRLEKMGTHDSFLLARDILIATQGQDSAIRSRAPLFVAQLLESSESLRHESDADHITTLLSHLKPDAASSCIITVTESLVSAGKQHLLEPWKDHLRRLHYTKICDIASSPLWHNIPVASSPSTSFLTQQQQIILRLWVLRIFNVCLPGGPVWRKIAKASDDPIIRLLTLYQNNVDEINMGSLLSSLREGVHNLGMPPSGILILAVDAKKGKRMTKATRSTLTRLESSSIPLLDLFANADDYNKMVRHLFSDFEKLVRQINVTSPLFVESSIHIASTGDIQSVMTLIRILRSHTPLKLALSKSWDPILEPSKKDDYPEQSTSEYPDPRAAVDMIHLIALSIASSKKLSARTAYGLIRWFYCFLVKYGAPVKPTLVRAIYHAGVVRYRREDKNIPRAQYKYILDLVREIEGPEVLDTLVSRIGQSGSATSQLELQ
ncbi:hypothetical protein BDV23DRAFT_117710 [Aspergillus alliaceus]|uniref:Uncharacterized protein n=1 Tax=Petromyces alliaceus TaxID=209559 RepID=A0A5N7C1Y4_PETAA|nr:hypothetical protein BDV23DRAFT_117710 [Aspergillus alliaceus]